MSSATFKALQRAWRLIPRSVRRPLFRAVTAFLAPMPSVESEATPGPVTVVGLLTSTSGQGYGARLCLSALHQAGLDTRSCDVSPAFLAQDLHGVSLPGQPVGKGDGGLLIAHLNPHTLPLAFMVLGKARVSGKRVAGYCAWELPAIPTNWKRGLKFVHEIWVPSRFTAEAFRPHTDLPIHIVPHPVARPLPARLSRADLGWPENAFVALTMFHMVSGFVRKNPIGAVRAFRIAFGDKPDAMLVVKVVDGELLPWAMKELESAVGGAPNIRIMDENLSQEGTDSLIQHADVILSLHRGEGFGLVLAQAMLLGKPVIATGWSGNMEFMSRQNSILLDYQLVPVKDPQGKYTQGDQKWADPDIDQAADWLVRLERSPELRREIGQAAAEDAADRFSLRSYLDTIGPSLALVRSRSDGASETEVA
ncbi:MAG: glycosyltransferase family 4 protein [Alphaproteobacteria bacterium]|nr:glycosyltransferase family 4 protein [Alphaproteobacteria bacterium]